MASKHASKWCVIDSSGEPLYAFMASSKCLKLVLPFLDAMELTRSSASSKELRFCANSLELWEALCQRYVGEELLTQRGVKVPWPQREGIFEDGDARNAKEYFETLYELFMFIMHKDAVSCDRCAEWTAIEDDALECEECLGKWCGSCAHRGPNKAFVPCKKCPDFSQSHCWECFAEGKTIQCECSGTDSWHSCCGRHAFHCSKCDATLCDGCQDCHDYDCPCKGETDSGEDEGWRGSQPQVPTVSHRIALDTVDQFFELPCFRSSYREFFTDVNRTWQSSWNQHRQMWGVREKQVTMENCLGRIHQFF